MTSAPPRRGVLAWFARSSVAANLLMLLLVAGGLLTAPRIAQEVFPEVTQRIVTVEVAYPGASPAEVEQGVLLPVEDAVRGLEGVKEVRSIATEGLGLVSVELILAADEQQLLDEVTSAVGRIVSFPEDAEEPVVTLATTRAHVVSIILHGSAPETSLRELAEQTREALIEDHRISYAELSGARPLEISIEVPREALRRHGLTLAQIAERVRASSIELPGGEVEEEGGEILLRTEARKDFGDELGRVVVLAAPDGSRLLLRDLADIDDALADTDQAAFFDGAPAARVDVYRVGDETPVEIARAVREHVEGARRTLPDGVRLTTWGDTSVIFSDRVELLLRNGYFGLAFVLVLLGLFLSPRLAFWVTLGIPISFLGALLFLPVFDVSINIISLFAFIITLGLVVDDAIVVGEAVQYEREQGATRMEASWRGVRGVAIPVVLAVSTTCVAFAPMLFVPGPAGELFRNIPIVVMLVLAASLAESLFVLPAHLAHPMPRPLSFLLRPFFFLMRLFGSGRVTRGLDRFVERAYVPVARRALRWRYLTVALAAFLLLGAMGLWAGGRIDFVFLPKIEADQVSATLEMSVGTRAEDTRVATLALEEAARRAARGSPDGSELVRGLYTEIGGTRGVPTQGAFESGGHLAAVRVDLGPAGGRSTTSRAFVERWREALAEIPGASQIAFEYTTAASAGADIDFEVGHADEAARHRAAEGLAAALGEYTGVAEVDPGFTLGKEQIDFDLTARGLALGLTEADLAAQLRSAFFGAEAFRRQRGRNEVRVYVRLPARERNSLAFVEELVLRTPEGGEIPLRDAARAERARADTAIQRVRGRRVVHVTANVYGETNANDVVRSVSGDAVERLRRRFPGLVVESGGAQENQNESLSSLGSGFAVALVGMYALLALAFRSYLQPFVVMTVIPLGAVGAIGGHLLLGHDLSLSSVMGLVALAGVVVNDSLLLVSTVNDRRAQGVPLDRAIVESGARRFRPVMLTSLTTFFGLAPMIFERSVQAQFLIPMALSLGFGVMFATLLTVFVVPCLYRILADFIAGWQRITNRLFGARQVDDLQQQPPV